MTDALALALAEIDRLRQVNARLLAAIMVFLLSTPEGDDK